MKPSEVIDQEAADQKQSEAQHNFDLEKKYMSCCNKAVDHAIKNLQEHHEHSMAWKNAQLTVQNLQLDKMQREAVDAAKREGILIGTICNAMTDFRVGNAGNLLENLKDALKRVGYQND